MILITFNNIMTITLFNFTLFYNQITASKRFYFIFKQRNSKYGRSKFLRECIFQSNIDRNKIILYFFIKNDIPLKKESNI